MHHFSPFELVPADTVEPGTIVLLTRRENVTTAALAVVLQTKRRAFVLFQSPEDTYGGKPGVMYASAFGSLPVLKVPHATAVLPVSPDVATFQPSSDDVPLGALSIEDDGRLVVTALVGGGTRMAYALDNVLCPEGDRLFGQQISDREFALAA